ncbi:MAG: DUF3047 domain-containing protein [Burkholderiaceae bacterium]|nr:DUF3047 domain-containing protein [Burkholderiaceae bacterium]
MAMFCLASIAALAWLAPEVLAAGPWLNALTGGTAEQPPAPWHVAGLPRQAKPFTRFRLVQLDGERVLRIEAERSYGNLVHAVPAHTSARWLSWRWRLDEPLAGTDLRRKDGDDSPLKVCAFFDEPLGAVPFVERQVLRMLRGMSEEPLPAASVCYVWDSQLAPGTALPNAFTRRIRTIVLRGPEAALHQWQSERRDIVADYLRLFGDETETVPPLIGIGVGADADNTQGRSLGHLGGLVLE